VSVTATAASPSRNPVSAAHRIVPLRGAQYARDCDGHLAIAKLRRRGAPNSAPEGAPGPIPVSRRAISPPQTQGHAPDSRRTTLPVRHPDRHLAMADFRQRGAPKDSPEGAPGPILVSGRPISPSQTPGLAPNGRRMPLPVRHPDRHYRPPQKAGGCGGSRAGRRGTSAGVSTSGQERVRAGERGGAGVERVAARQQGRKSEAHRRKRCCGHVQLLQRSCKEVVGLQHGGRRKRTPEARRAQTPRARRQGTFAGVSIPGQGRPKVGGCGCAGA
jgi:hypothetical protein